MIVIVKYFYTITYMIVSKQQWFNVIVLPQKKQYNT